MRSENPALSSDLSSLHAGFEAETREKTIRDLRLAAVIAGVFYMLFLILDYFAYPSSFLTFLLIRCIVVFGSGLFFLVMWTPVGKAHPRLFAMLEYLLCGSGIVVMVHLSGGYTSSYYAGVILVLLFFISIVPLDDRRTLLICVILYAMYLVPILALQRIARFDIFLNNNFFLFTTITLVGLGSRLATQMRFREFSGRFNLARANEELKKLDILKSQFFANVSHEVRSPLTSILSPIQSLYQGDLGPLPPEHQTLVGQVYRNALKLLDMVNQMLDFSKFEARKMQLRLKHLDIDELARDVVTTFQDVTERKGLKLRYVVEGDLPPAYLDAEKLERILTNLIRNAIKFTDGSWKSCAA